MKKTHVFLGTYFDKSDVLRLDRTVRIIGWISLVVYAFGAGYNALQAVLNIVSNGFTPDWYLYITILTQLIQGFVIFAILNVISRLMLILMDLEDNTRRAARHPAQED